MTIYTFYKIVCNDSNVTQIYVGSTVNLKNRKKCHKYDCINPNSNKYNLKVYKFIRDNGGWNNWQFVILETKECIDEYEAYQIEQQYIDNLKSELNSQSSYTRLTKHDYFKQYNTHYRRENPEYDKQRYQQNNLSEKYCCLLCKGSYTYHNIFKHEQTQKHLKFINK